LMYPKHGLECSLLVGALFSCRHFGDDLIVMSCVRSCTRLNPLLGLDLGEEAS